MRKKNSLLLIGLLITLMLPAQERTDVLVIGGGAGGTAAAIQAARMGAKVHIIEATPWLGGMLTSAGVSAIDGNHEMPSGIWGEFRQRLRTHYGGAEALATGWVSHTLFEPSIGNRILQEMADIPNINIIFNATYKDVQKDNGGWKVDYLHHGKTRSVRSKILIDATETGDLLPLVDADFRLGMDSRNDTEETEAPDNANDILQDLTYVVILEDILKDPMGAANEVSRPANDTLPVSPSASQSATKKSRRNAKKRLSHTGLVRRPKNYDPANYECACQRENGDMFGGVSSCEQMLAYGKLPNNKYMINWPNCGNDFYVGWATLTVKERQKKLVEAKAFTQGFVYYIQNDLGFDHLRVAEEFPTEDNFPMIPYNREARRIRGKVFLTLDHLERPYDFGLYRTGVAVGDYPIDHHHDKNPAAPEIDFINMRVPSYNIPLGSLIPETIENFIVAEKNISVSNIVNGTTRLQPVVLGIGQAAGALAATAILQKKRPAEVSIRLVQNALLKSKAYLMPFIDVDKDDTAFAAIQRIGATGILRGYGVPYKWANQTWFYPKRIVSEYELREGLLRYYPKLDKWPASGTGVTVSFITSLLNAIEVPYAPTSIEANWKSWGIERDFGNDEALDRRTVSILIDNILNPFERPIDFDGILKE